MELKTDGGIYLTREEYRKSVEKVMDRQSKLSLLAVAQAMIEEHIDPEKLQDGMNHALMLQVQALQNMERVLFGKEPKDEWEKEK